MEKEKIIQILKINRKELDRFHVASVSLFGSVVRGEAGTSSDIDILVEFSEPVGIFDFIRLKLYLEKILGSPVDLVTPDALKDRLKSAILEEAIHAA